MFMGKTRKSGKRRYLHAVAVLDMNGVTGVVRFRSLPRGPVSVDYEIQGLSDGLHGFHIHQYGDLTEGCKSACAHFNPRKAMHGGPYSRVRHAGDLGNVRVVDGRCRGSVRVTGISLNQMSPSSIIGRAIVLHEDRDDLGRGPNPESLRTGNAGKRIACAVIGISSLCNK